MKKLLMVVAFIALVTLGVIAIAQGPSPYETRTCKEYRQMLVEGK